MYDAVHPAFALLLTQQNLAFAGDYLDGLAQQLEKRTPWAKAILEQLDQPGWLDAQEAVAVYFVLMQCTLFALFVRARLPADQSQTNLVPTIDILSRILARSNQGWLVKAISVALGALESMGGFKQTQRLLRAVLPIGDEESIDQGRIIPLRARSPEMPAWKSKLQTLLGDKATRLKPLSVDYFAAALGRLADSEHDLGQEDRWLADLRAILADLVSGYEADLRPRFRNLLQRNEVRLFLSRQGFDPAKCGLGRYLRMLRLIQGAPDHIKRHAEGVINLGQWRNVAAPLDQLLRLRNSVLHPEQAQPPLTPEDFRKTYRPEATLKTFVDCLPPLPTQR